MFSLLPDCAEHAKAMKKYIQFYSNASLNFLFLVDASESLGNNMQTVLSLIAKVV